MTGHGDPSVRLRDRRPLAAADVGFLIGSIAPAVDARGRAGTPHGRISPAALSIDPAGNPQLIDVSDSDEAVIYAAPEIRDTGLITGQSEVYSLGNTTYTLLTGHPPNPYGFATVRRDRPDLGPGVDGVLLQATARSPELRFATATEFATALSEALDQPVHASTIPVRSPAPAPEPELVVPAPAARAAPDPRRRFELPEAALPIVFLLLIVLAAAGFMALFLSGS
ncbi:MULTISPECIES: hypothetical protein [Tsukamurella]|uniref:Serine/threonine protein kinase n=2 Tax=Tsukamurella TaxID=2060 RepID=A0A5C5RZT6_9ACTN|nr:MULTISPECIES: hypothetical protein [Tsukamurella]NMD55550.1 hypothetical protein [Tsukamurella columbiensis]TWS28112.1 hypothetical protein FK530_15625 [Tsukamurella conjunctivitidis]